MAAEGGGTAAVSVEAARMVKEEGVLRWDEENGEWILKAEGGAGWESEMDAFIATSGGGEV